MYSEHTRDQKTSFGRSPQYQVHDASRRNENVSRFEENILVAWNEEGNNGVCVIISTMSTSQGRTSKASRIIVIATNTGMEMGAHHDGFCSRTTELT